MLHAFNMFRIITCDKGEYIERCKIRKQLGDDCTSCLNNGKKYKDYLKKQQNNA